MHFLYSLLETELERNMAVGGRENRKTPVFFNIRNLLSSPYSHEKIKIRVEKRPRSLEELGSHSSFMLTSLLMALRLHLFSCKTQVLHLISQDYSWDEMRLYRWKGFEMMKCRKYDYVCCVCINPRQLKWRPDRKVQVWAGGTRVQERLGSKGIHRESWITPKMALKVHLCVDDNKQNKAFKKCIWN